MSKNRIYDAVIRVSDQAGNPLYDTEPHNARALVAAGAEERGNGRRVYAIVLSPMQCKAHALKQENPETPGSLGGQAYSHKRETPQNPMNVWTLKRISPQDAHLFRLSVTENMAAA